jgi:hypothetical protein
LVWFDLAFNQKINNNHSYGMHINNEEPIHNKTKEESSAFSKVEVSCNKNTSFFRGNLPQKPPSDSPDSDLVPGATTEQREKSMDASART